MTTKKQNSQPNDKSLATNAIDLIIKDCSLVHNQNKEAFAIIEINGTRQVQDISSKGFSQFVASKFFSVYKFPISETTIKTVINTLRGKALFEGKPVQTFTRIAKTEEGYWIDLCDEKWQAVLVRKDGWQVLSGKSVPLFQRSQSMKNLPVPKSGGSIDELWSLVNIPIANRWMVVAWLVECLRADTPHVVMELVGEQGSAKSTTQKILKLLIDPCTANLKASPKNVEDVWVGATNCHLVSFENISFLSNEYQDALCVLATGGALTKRTLYTNQDETVLELRKPIILNGISVNVTAQDLLDRSIHIELPPVKSRLQSNSIETAFVTLYPQLFGALLDQFVTALKVMDQIFIDEADRPRMLDFAYLGEAVYQANGFAAGVFLNSYENMRKKGVHRTIESSPVGVALLQYLELNPKGWAGKLQELLPLLPKPAGESNWPRSAKGLGDVLRRLAPGLRSIGIECWSQHKQSGSIIWEVRPTSSKVSFQSPTSPTSPELAPDLGHEGHQGLENHSFEGG